MQAIHPQLQQGTHLLGECGTGTLLLHRNALLPWLIVVPPVEATDLSMLDAAIYHQVMSEVRTIGVFIKHHFRCDHINIASIGNLVPQLHIHIVGRHKGDACWPLPVWGHLTDSTAYTASQVEAIRKALLSSHVLRHPDPEPA